MNRLAVVLAADSATTVTHRTESGETHRYFKGANKIFQLSNYRPVGVMIFDSAALLSVPWEVVAKEFRSELGDKSYDHVRNYAEAFFEFLDNNQLLFPLEVRQRTFIEAARSAAVYNAHQATESIPAGANAQQSIDAAIAARRAALDAKDFPPCVDQAKLNAAIAASKDEIKVAVEAFFQADNSQYLGDLDAVAELGLVEVFKEPDSYLGTTGIVFAGFGDKDVFPSMVEYQSCSYIGNDHVEFKKEEHQIDHDRPALLSAFAQTSMSETFRIGLSKDFYGSLMVTLADGMTQLANDVIAASGGNAAAVPNLAAMVSQTRVALGKTVLERASKENAQPLQRVIGSLPIEEMANLAETLINLQSLKERVTKPTEEVGGPVDVAVITRSEGLVWIKRKHFFPGELNSRFQQRQSALYK